MFFKLNERIWVMMTVSYSFIYLFIMTVSYSFLSLGVLLKMNFIDSLHCKFYEVMIML